jgi:hypothetical protein
MKVTEREATNRVRTINVPDGKQTQTEKKTLKNCLLSTFQIQG